MNTHLLLVSDDESIRRLVVVHLTQAGYQITEVRSGTAAIAALLSKKTELALAILDGQLPPVSGAHVVAVVREAGCKTPILLASGSFIACELPLGEQGFCFLSKPFTKDDLLHAVAGLLPK